MREDRRERIGSIRHPSDQSDIDAAACTWLVRIEDGRLGRKEQNAFRLWLASDARHREAFEAVCRTWADFNELSHLERMIGPDPVAISTPRWGRTAIGATWPSLVATGLVVAIGMYVWWKRPDASYDTHIGEVMDVDLSDGSRITVGALSDVSVTFSSAERSVTLEDGRAYFEVAPDAARPFVVEAGDVRVRVVGTKFELSRSPYGVNVSVLEGLVTVTERGGMLEEGETVKLHANEQITLGRGSRSAADHKSAKAPKPIQASLVGAWREGRLSYDNAALAELINDVNRYYAPGVEMSGMAVGELRITASFRTREIAAFLENLPAALPVKIIRHPDSSITIAERGS